MSQINITFAGLSIFHLANDTWKIVFICDDTHPINFMWKKNADPWSEPIKLAPKGTERQTIIMEVKNPKPPLTTPTFPPTLFDITAEYAHRNGVRWHDSGSLGLAFMSMPNSTLMTQSLTKIPYEIRQVKPISKPAARLNLMARVMVATIEIAEGGSLQLLTENGGEITPLLPYDLANTYYLDFYNDCDRTSKKLDDFELYYQLLEDVNDPTIQFIAGENTYKPVSSVFSKKDTDEKLILAMPGHGNCDPIGGGKGIFDFPDF